MAKRIIFQMIVLLMIAGTAFATETTQIDLGSNSGVKGSTVTIPITLTNISGISIAAIGMDIGYDTSILENPDATIGPAGNAAGKDVIKSTPSSGLFRIGVIGLNNTVIGNGIAVYVTFTIKTTASTGSAQLSNTPSAADPDGNPLIVSGLNGSVIVTDIQPGNPKISAKPSSVNLGSIKVGGSVSKTLTIKNTGPGYLLLNSMTITGTNASEFRATSECSAISGRESCPIILSFEPTTPFGKKVAVLSISSNDPKKPTVDIKLSGQSPPPKISVSPMSVNLGSIPVGGTSSPKIVTVKNTGISDLLVNSIAVTGANASEFNQTYDCTTVSNGSACTATVTFTPSIPYGTKNAVMTISSNDPKKPTLNVKLSAQAPPPKISASPSSVTFGNLAVGSTSAPKTVKIKNTGTSDLVVSDINITGANASEFSRTSSCGTIPKGMSCTLDLTFTPALTGKKSASLDISSNVPSKPIISLKLNGTGI